MGKHSTFISSDFKLYFFIFTVPAVQWRTEIQTPPREQTKFNFFQLFTDSRIMPLSDLDTVKWILGLPWQQGLSVWHRPARCQVLGLCEWYPVYAGMLRHCTAAEPHCGCAVHLGAWKASTDSNRHHRSTPSQATGLSSAEAQAAAPLSEPVSSLLCLEVFVEL